jgi:hypothetical protein
MPNAVLNVFYCHFLSPSTNLFTYYDELICKSIVNRDLVLTKSRFADTLVNYVTMILHLQVAANDINLQLILIRRRFTLVTITVTM